MKNNVPTHNPGLIVFSFLEATLLIPSAAHINTCTYLAQDDQKRLVGVNSFETHVTSFTREPLYKTYNDAIGDNRVDNRQFRTGIILTFNKTSHNLPDITLDQMEQGIKDAALKNGGMYVDLATIQAANRKNRKFPSQKVSGWQAESHSCHMA